MHLRSKLLQENIVFGAYKEERFRSNPSNEVVAEMALDVSSEI